MGLLLPYTHHLPKGELVSFTRPPLSVFVSRRIYACNQTQPRSTDQLPHRVSYRCLAFSCTAYTNTYSIYTCTHTNQFSRPDQTTAADRSRILTAIPRSRYDNIYESNTTTNYETNLRYDI